MATIIPFSQLGQDALGFEFEGYKFDNTPATIIVVIAQPGEGPKLHSHPYKEIFVVLTGSALFTVGEKEIAVDAGNLVIVPAEMPHKFVNSGNSVLRQVDIHLNERFITHWLE